jgi:transposase InsO family protein
VSKAQREEIIKAYRTVGHPVAFSAPARVANYFHISVEQAKKILQQIDSYTRHREFKRPRYYNPYFVYEPGLYQSDLMETRALAPYNDGTNYLCLIICVFSRKIWVYPMKRKTGQAMRAVLSGWLDELPLHARVKTHMSDRGKEYDAAPVRELLQSAGIGQQWAIGTSKAAYAERAQKTFQILLYKYLTDHETFRFLDVLPDLVRTYNTRGHRSLEGMTPNEAFRKRNRARVRGIHMTRYRKTKRRAPRFQVGDIVRVKSLSSKIATAARSYVEQFKAEYFIVSRVNTKLPVPMYEIKSLDSGEQIIGQFYGAELTRVEPQSFKVEKVLRWRGKAPHRQALVKWLHFSDSHNSWVDEKDILEVF